MSSDSEIDELQQFEASKQRELARKAGISGKDFQPEELSDEEVLALHSDDDYDSEHGQEEYYDQDDDAIAQKRSRTSREVEHNWGATRDNYFGGEDDIGQDEGASEEEEEEALRIRQQELEDLDEADFYDKDDLETWKARGDDEEMKSVEDYKPISPSTMSSKERKELIREKFPMVSLLSGELAKFEEWDAELRDDTMKSDDLKQLGEAALNTYKGLIYTFFALFNDRLAEGDSKGLHQLEEHPINEGLLLARQLWLNYRNLKAGKPEVTSSSRTEVYDSKPSDDNLSADKQDDLEKHHSVSYLSEFSDSEVSEDAYIGLSDNTSDEEDNDFRIAKPNQATSKANNIAKYVGDFDEAADTIEKQARAKNKQSLRFYASQIGKNDRSKLNLYSGDIDLPYKEREYERRQRLLAAAQARGQTTHNDEEEFFSDDVKDDDSNNLYAQAKIERDNAKMLKKQRHTEAVLAARAGRVAEYLSENPDVDKRAINYQIEKNKGLTKSRKKENRNPRVKKRLRYEAAQKKLKSIRKVYKESQGPYQGELSGIRKNLSHSAKFKY